MNLDKLLQKEILVKMWPIGVGVLLILFAIAGPEYDPTSPSTLRRRRSGLALSMIYEIFGEAGVKVAMIVIALVLIGVGIQETRKALRTQARKR